MRHWERAARNRQTNLILQAQRRQLTQGRNGTGLAPKSACEYIRILVATRISINPEKISNGKMYLSNNPTNIINEKVELNKYLLPFHAKNTERIRIKFGAQVVYNQN